MAEFKLSVAETGQFRLNFGLFQGNLEILVISGEIEDFYKVLYFHIFEKRTKQRTKSFILGSSFWTQNCSQNRGFPTEKNQSFLTVVVALWFGHTESWNWAQTQLGSFSDPVCSYSKIFDLLCNMAEIRVSELRFLRFLQIFAVFGY